MRIKDKGQFALGVFNILISIIGLIILIFQHRTRELLLLVICFACGITGILNGIETKAQRQKRKAELKEKAKLYGWYEEDDEQND